MTASGDHMTCSLKGLEVKMKRESRQVLHHSDQFQEYCEAARTMMEAWMNSDVGANGVPAAEALKDLVVVAILDPVTNSASPGREGVT